MDIRPPQRPPVRPVQLQQPQQSQPPQPQMQPNFRPQQSVAPQQYPQQSPISSQPPVLPPIGQLKATKPKRSKRWLFVLLGILLLGIITVGGLWFWYQSQLEPVNSGNSEKVLVKIPEASTPDTIASILKEENVIKNEMAFLWYTRLNNVQNQLKAGSFRLSPSESTSQIVEHLVKGNVDTFSITFFPGATLVDNVRSPEKRTDVTTVLKKAGYSESEIFTALNRQYDHPLFAGKPASADLEGYVFGETYEFFSGVSVEDILTETFDEFYKYVQQENLVALYEAKGLSLYEGITLASIIQRESGGDDKAQIAQVFFSRLAVGMPLGSDVTYQYIADKEGNERDTNYDSPYNTRVNAGLPPGPIAVPGLSALKAVALPAEGDYLYFLSGDDHVTYYGRTLEEHEANIRNHCQQKCQII